MRSPSRSERRPATMRTSAPTICSTPRAAAAVAAPTSRASCRKSTMKPSIEAWAQTSSAPPAPRRQMRGSRVGGGAGALSLRRPGAGGGSRMSTTDGDGGGEAEPGESDEGRVEPPGVDHAGQGQRRRRRRRAAAPSDGCPRAKPRSVRANQPMTARPDAPVALEPEHAGDEQGDEQGRVGRRECRADEGGGAAGQSAGHDRALAYAIGERAPRHEGDASRRR